MKSRLFPIVLPALLASLLFLPTAQAKRFKPSLIQYTAIHYIIDNETGTVIPSFYSTFNSLLTPNNINTSLPVGKSEFTFTTTGSIPGEQSEINLIAKDASGNSILIESAINFATWNYCSSTSNNLASTCRTRTDNSIYNIYVTINKT